MAAILMVILVLGAMASMWLSGVGAMRSQQKELEKLQEARAKFGDVIEEYNALEQQKVELAKRIDIINEIVSDRIIWSRQLWNLSRLTPDNIWLSGVKIEERSIKTTQIVYDPKRKEYKEKRVVLKKPVLAVSGYVVPDADRQMRFFPFTEATENDEEFSAMFELRDQKREVTSFNGRPVLSFELDYLILQGKSGEAVE